MKFHAQIFEQLKEAAFLIDRNTPTSTRLAIILIDNIFELLIYEKVQKEFVRDRVFPPMSKYSENFRQETMRDFHNLLRFCLNNIKLFSKQHFDIIDICHKTRNEAYHENILRDEIIIGIARAYFQTFCELHEILLPGSWSSPTDSYLKSILKDIGVNSFSRNEISAAIQRLSHGRECNCKIFAERMSSYLNDRIDHLIENLNWISSFINPSSNIITEKTQNELVFSQLANQEVPGLLEKYYNGESLASYNVRIKVKDLRRWRSMSDRIKEERDIRNILWKYYLIDVDLSYIEEIVDTLVSQIDEYFELQADIMMGK
jgi:hypothetical protein